MKRALIILITSWLLVVSGKAQDFVPYPNEDVLGWPTDAYESYIFADIPFRILFPPGFDAEGSEKYPLILFFHGAGERGTDNEKQLVHGGQLSLNAVNSGEFPGVLLYPQHNNGGGTWGPWIDRAKDVVDKLIDDYNIDPNRIYVHGLSGGGEATWRFAAFNPTYVAAMHPMSAAGSNFLEPSGVPEPYVHIPIWSSQGGNDKNPTPAEGNFMVNTIRDSWGGNIRYTYYPNSGHNTWNSQYNQPDFFTWFLEKEKTDILIRFGDGRFCEDDVINVDLGVTPGFDNYEWTLNDTTSTVIASGSMSNEINVTDTGRYYVRFQRGTEWTKWSKPAHINRNRPPSTEPIISAGLQSVNLPGLDGSQSVTFSGPADKDSYQWFLNGSVLPGAVQPELTVGTAGQYALSIQEPGGSGVEADGITPTEFRADPQGCPSELSPSITVTTSNGVNVPARPSNFFVNAVSSNTIVVNWDDNASNELGFELYRSTSSGSNYSLIAKVDATNESNNPQQYVDSNLTPNTTYYYRLRAVNNDGGSAYTNEVNATTDVDSESPSAPILSLAQTTQNSISLTWTASNDNSGIAGYDIFRDNSFIGNVDGDILNFTNTGLPLGEFFTYTVRARDLSGNTSIQSNQVSGVTVNSGLSYRYYHHNNLSTVDDIEANGTFIESGTTNNFDITLRTQDNRFAFIWDGYILIQTAGDYTFYTDSDDGSKLFINGQQIVNNDGTHGCIEKNGVITLAEGFAEIQVRMFDNGGGECLTVEWQGPGISKENIPDDILYENPFSTPVPPSAPIVLNATSIDFQQIDLSWTDTSSDETGFEIYRSLSSSGGFQLVRVTAANETTWSDSGLNGETTYYYLINSINLNGSSETVGPASATTLSAPSAPSAPSGLTLQALSSTSVKVDWTDNSSDETGFELYRTTVDPGVTIDDDYVLTLDGSNDYVAIDNFFYNSSGLSELTVETWIKTSDGSNQVICSFDRNEYFRLEIDGSAADAGRIGFGIFTNGGQIDLGGSTRVDDGNWHHVAATYVNGVASIYVDGVLDASLSQGTTFGTGNIRYGFIGVGSEATSFDGSRGPTDYFNGELDEFRIWSVGRSQTEVSENRFVSLVGSEPGLQTYYRITESSGPTIADATATGATGFLRDDVAFSQINPSLVELNSFTLIHTSSADATSYTDNSVYGNNTYYYRVRAFGAGGNSAYTSVENVTTPNLPPVIDEIIDRSVKFDTSLDVDIIANDPDGDAISLSFDVALPSFATFQDNGYGIGRITFNPTSEDQGSYPLTVTADDGSGGLDTESFIITVSDNDNPTIVAIPNQLLEEGFASSVNVSVTDPQTQAAISITADNLPAFANFVDNGNGQGTIAFSSGIGDAGFYPNIRIVASDGEGGFSEEFFNLTVNEVDPFFSLQINFSTSASTGPSPWNNFVTTNNGISNLVSNEGVTTDVGLQTFDATNAKFNEAYIADLADGVYPNDVLETFWFKFGGTVVMRLQNLNPSLFYDLSFFAGVNDDFERQSDGPTLGAQKRTRITVDGNVQTIDFANNNSNLLQFTGIQPDLNGEIVIQVTKPNGSVPYFVLNALVVDAYFNNGLAPEAPDNLNLTATSSSEVNVQWADNSNNETRFEIYRSDVSESGPFVLAGNAALNSTSFLDTNLTGSTLYYYKVRAVNVNGFGETGIGLVTTLNSPPTITTINDVTLSSNSNLILPVSATDLEDNTIFLTSINLPDFITFLDNGDGTGAFTFNPTSTDANFNGSITLEAIDNFGSNSSASFFVTVTDDQFSEVIYINFDLNSMASNPWNNLEANPNSQPSYSNLLTGTGNPSTVGLTVNSGWSGVADDGLTSGNNTFAYPDDVVRSYWYTTGTASMTITGLVPGTYYNIDLLATTDQWIYTNSDYSLGSLTKSISATNNGDEIEFFSSLLADGSGEIDITINALTNAQRAFINAIVIKRADSSIPISPKELLANGISQSQISLSWEDNSNNETGFEIYRSNGPGEIFTLINTTAANETSYLDGGHQKNTAYIYKIRAVNANGNSAYSNESTAITIDQRILVNINASISGFDQAPAPWNNTNAVPEDGTVFSNFLNESGQVTSVGLELQTWSSGQTNNSGFQTGDDSGIYPDEVLQGYYYLNDFESADLLLNNLNDSLVYDLHFFGTENGTFTPAAGPGIADFSSGTVTETLFTEFNTVETVVLEDLAPTANGSIPFQVSSSDANGSRFAFFSSLVIEAHRPVNVVFDKILPSAPSNLMANNINETSLDLNWGQSSDNTGVLGYEIYQNGSLVSSVSSESFSVIDLIPGGTYLYSVRSFDGNGNFSEFSEGLEITLPNSQTQNMYYSSTVGAIDMSNLTSWGSNTDGTGTNPSNFSNDNQTFVLQANSTLVSDFTISGVSSKLIVEDGVNLTLDATLTAYVDVNGSGSLMINSEVSPVFGSLSANSTITFNSTSINVPAANYGNLILSNNGSTKSLGNGNVNIDGSLIIEEGVSLLGSTPNLSEITIKGDVTILGTPNLPNNQELVTLNFNSGNGQNLTLDADEDIRLNSLRVSNSTSLTINPVTSQGMLQIGSDTGGGIAIESGSDLNIGNQTLSIVGRGTINADGENGLIHVSKGNISIVSNSQENSTLNFAPAADTVSNLTVNLSSSGALLINSKVHVDTELDLIDGNIDINDTLVLVSDALNTARIAEIQGRGIINGTVQYQRYLTPERLYRYLSTPVTGTTVADWQEHIPVSGSFSGASTGPGISSNPSLFYYWEPLGGWLAYPDVSNSAPMNAGTGYAIFVRDDIDPTTLKLEGEVLQGDFNFNISAGTGDGTDGWNLVGNPYPSPIQWSDIGWSSSNISPAIWIRDNVQGGFKTYDRQTGIGDIENGYISSGQSFWIQAIDASPSLQISENAKTPSPVTDAPIYRIGTTPSDIGYIQLTLTGNDQSDNSYLIFGEDFENAFEPATDVVKRSNDGLNVYSTVRDSLKLVMNKLNDGFCEMNIPITFDGANMGEYILSVDLDEKLPFDPIIDLYDATVDQWISVDNFLEYTFDVTQENDSSGRFIIRISRPQLEDQFDLTQNQSEICEANLTGHKIVLNDTQRGAHYSLFENGKSLDYSIIGNGGSMEFSVDTHKWLSGQYEFTVEASFPNCSSTLLKDTIHLNIHSAPQVSVDESVYTICSGSDLSISLNDHTEDLVYEWIVDGILVEENGPSLQLSQVIQNSNILVEAIDSKGCKSIDPLQISIELDQRVTPEIIDEGTFLRSSISDADKYEWFLDGIPIEDSNLDRVEKRDGPYQVAVWSGACYTLSEVFIVTSTLEDFAQKISIYPNPTKDFVYISGVTTDYTVEVMDETGKFLNRISIDSSHANATQIDLSSLKQGLYIIKIESKEMVSFTRVAKY